MGNVISAKAVIGNAMNKSKRDNDLNIAVAPSWKQLQFRMLLSFTRYKLTKHRENSLYGFFPTIISRFKGISSIQGLIWGAPVAWSGRSLRRQVTR